MQWTLTSIICIHFGTCYLRYLTQLHYKEVCCTEESQGSTKKD
jgi:hypothetical protein